MEASRVEEREAARTTSGGRRWGAGGPPWPTSTRYRVEGGGWKVAEGGREGRGTDRCLVGGVCGAEERWGAEEVWGAEERWGAEVGWGAELCGAPALCLALFKLSVLGSSMAESSDSSLQVQV